MKIQKSIIPIILLSLNSTGGCHKIKDFTASLSGSEKKEDSSTTSTSNEKIETEVKKELPRVTNRLANEYGDIFVAEYHRITPEEGLYARSVANFKKDLKKMYDLGFRPVTACEYLDNKMDIPPGSSPIILTFDDSSISQFKLLPDGKIDPDCAVGVMDEFAKTHPDFPVKAVFYILPSQAFGQKGFLKQKLKMLKDWGCEIGSHTISHKSLKNMTDDQVKKELADSVEWIRSLGFNPRTMAVPYGVMPKNRKLLQKFTYNNKEYGFEANFRSQGRTGRPPKADKPDNPLNFPRLIADDKPLGLTHYLNQVEKGTIAPYVMP